MRLTKDMREDIANALLKRKFDPVKQRLKEIEHTLADDILLHMWSDRYPDFTFPPSLIGTPPDWMPCSTPVEWFPVASYITAQCGEQFAALYYREPRRVPACFSTHTPQRIYPADHTFTDRVRNLLLEQKQMQMDYREMRREIHTVLDSVTTVNKLLAVWPEVTEVLKPFMRPKTRLPAVSLDKLNHALGLVDAENGGSTA